MKPTTSLLGKLGDGWVFSRREIPHCLSAPSMSVCLSAVCLSVFLSILSQSDKQFSLLFSASLSANTILTAHFCISTKPFMGCKAMPGLWCPMSLTLQCQSFTALPYAPFLNAMLPPLQLSVCRLHKHTVLQAVFLWLSRRRVSQALGEQRWFTLKQEMATENAFFSFSGSETRNIC